MKTGMALVMCVPLVACSGGEAAADAAMDGEDAADAAGEPDGCACAPGLHNSRIIVVSDESEIWSFDPDTLGFELVTGPACGGTASPYSMAVDEAGIGWILFIESRCIMQVDLNDPAGCTDSGYEPGVDFGLFGMAFTGEDAEGVCPSLFVLTYSGSGPFSEGPGIGAIGRMDPDSLEIAEVGRIDFDGGELSGTRSGRLFAFVGVDPAKLVEYGKSDAGVLDVLPLEGMEKTNASAFAFFGGDVYFFTEAPPAGCIPCLEATCPGDYAACAADPVCEEHMECAMTLGEVSDECGGAMPAALQSCMFVDCVAECDLSASERVSRVTRLDYDGSLELDVVVDEAPIRVVGAGTSPCVPETPH